MLKFKKKVKNSKIDTFNIRKSQNSYIATGLFILYGHALGQILYKLDKIDFTPYNNKTLAFQIIKVFKHLCRL